MCIVVHRLFIAILCMPFIVRYPHLLRSFLMSTTSNHVLFIVTFKKILSYEEKWDFGNNLV